MLIKIKNIYNEIIKQVKQHKMKKKKKKIAHAFKDVRQNRLSLGFTFMISLVFLYFSRFFLVAWFIWVKVFNIGQSKICRRQPVKNFTWFILERRNSYNLNKIDLFQ